MRVIAALMGRKYIEALLMIAKIADFESLMSVIKGI